MPIECHVATELNNRITKRIYIVMRTNIFRGFGVAVITPFTAEGNVDFYALRELINRIIEEGEADFLCVLGTTAETPTLSEGEKELIMETFVDTVDGRVPLLLGCGGNNTHAVCRFLEGANLDGFDGILVVTPYYNKPTQEGLYQHFVTIADASPLPVVLYNVPGRTGVNLDAKTTLRIAEDCPNVVAIKEASGKLQQIEQIIAEAPDGFGVISGDDGLTIHLLTIGAVGLISVVGNAFPAEMCQLVHHAMDGRMDEALDIHRRFREISRLAFLEGNPAGVKAMLAHMEQCANVLRLPLVPVSEATEARIVAAVDHF